MTQAPPARTGGRHAGLTFTQKLSNFDTKASPYFYISPYFLLFAVFGAFPLVYTIYVSLFNWSLLSGQGEFAGFDNYAWALWGDGSERFWKSLLNTMSIFLLSSGPQVLMAVVLAAVLDQQLKAQTFWRMSVLLPYVVAPAAVAMIFGRIFSETTGPIPGLIKTFFPDPENPAQPLFTIDWDGEVLPSHIAIATMVNFRWTGYNTLILLAAMQAIPRDVYESAAIDGAGAGRRFWSITIPLIRPTLIFVIITSTIGGLQIFTEPLMFSQLTSYGGNRQQFLTIVLYLWDIMMNRQNYGRAAAMAWILFFIIVMISLVNYLISRLIATQEVKRGRGARAVESVKEEEL